MLKYGAMEQASFAVKPDDTKREITGIYLFISLICFSAC